MAESDVIANQKQILKNQKAILANQKLTPYFRQDEALIRYVLTEPPDRVSYRMLNPTDQEMQRIADMGVRAGILEKRADIRDIVDRSFIPDTIHAADIR